jgi:hypothetical protein
MYQRHPLASHLNARYLDNSRSAVAIVAILAARKGKPYIYGLAFTFGA